MTTNFIFNEVLSGTVDGVNKIFTALNPIESIEDLRVGGADYTNFSFTGNTVTLADAPTISTGAPSIDYFIAGSNPLITPSNKTFAEFVTEVYEDIGQFNTSKQYPITMVQRYVKEELAIHLNKQVNPMRKVSSYSFNKANDMVATAYSATEINVGTIPTYTPATGKILVGWAEVVDYNNLTSTSFASLSGLSIVYGAGAKVTIGYKIPEGVKKPSEVILNGNLLTFADFREYIATQSEGLYTIHEGYLFLPRTSGDVVVTVTYVKDNVVPIDDTYVIDFEPEYLNVIRFATIVKMMVFREDTRLPLVKEEYNKAWKDYRSYIARQHNGTNNQMRARGYGKLGYGFSSNYRRR